MCGGHAELRERGGRDHRRNHEAARIGERAEAGVLVVDGGEGGDAELPRRGALRIRRVTDGDVEPLAREVHQLRRPLLVMRPLAVLVAVGVVPRADGQGSHAPRLRQRPRVGEAPHRHRDGMSALLERGDHRLEEQDVRRVRQVDPDAHAGRFNRGDGRGG